MQTIDIINDLIEEAQFWMGESSNFPTSLERDQLNLDYGLFDDNENKPIIKYDWPTRANFCLLIAAALES